MTSSRATIAAFCLSAGTLAAQTTPEKVPLTPAAATASTHDGNLPGNTLDGSLSTRWSGYGDGAWIRFDLGAVRAVENVRIAFYRGNERKNRLDLQLSEDGTTWNTALSGATSTGTTTGLQTFLLWNARGRYLRYVGHGYTANTGSGLWNSLTEVEVYAQPGPLGPPTGLRPQTGNGQVLLTWDAVPAASSYQLRRRIVDCDAAEVVVWVPARSGAVQSHLDTTVTEGQRYLYTVGAHISAGPIEPSAPVAITPARTVPSITTVTATAGAAGSGRINLSWTPVFTATRYAIHRTYTSNVCPSCGPGPFTLLTTIDAPTTLYADTAATPGVTFFYRVVAANEHGAGDISNTAQAYSAPATPTPRPTGPTPTPCGCPAPTPTPGPITAAPSAITPHLTPGANRVWLRWWIEDYRVPNRAFKYTILRSLWNCGPYQKVAEVRNPQNITQQGSYVDTGLVNGRLYYYLIVGTNPMGDSTNVSGPAATPVEVLPSPPPGTVRTYVYPAPNPLAVEVIWSEVWDADSYTVKRSTTSGGPYTTIATGVVKKPGSSAVTYDDPNVQYETTYYYVITAVNTAGESGTSAEGSAHTGSGPPPPPANLVATATGNAGEVQLTWEASAGATAYSCDKGTQPGGPYQQYGYVYPPQTSLLLVRLLNDVRHYFVCRAYGSGGSSGPSTEASAVPTGALSAPTGVGINVVVSGGQRCLQLHWNPVSGAAGYHVRRSGLSTGPWNHIGSSTETFYNDCTAAVETRYYYTVAAYAGPLSESAPSAPISGIIAGEVEVTPPTSAVTASTHDGNLPGNTVDKNLSTRWSASGSGVWIQYDLGSVRNVSSLRIGVYRGNERRNGFSLAHSTDGTTWGWLANGLLTSGTTTALETVDVSDTPARFIRYFGHGAQLLGGGTTGWNSVTEVGIYAVP